MNAPLSRRSLLQQAAGLGVTVSFLGGSAFAAADGAMAKRKMVVVICRGGMDGLTVSPPVGDPDYAALRGAVAVTPDQALKLDGTFGLHPALESVHALALKGQARIAPAIASPDRARSHFEAQDVLETGAAQVYGVNTGWLNRTLEVMGPSKVEGLSVGATAPLILRGKVQAASWSPGKGVDETARLPTLLQDLYKADPMMGRAFARGLETEAMAQAAMTGLNPAPPVSTDAAAMAPKAMWQNAVNTQGMAPPAMAQNAQAIAGQRQGREAARKLGSTLAGFMVQEGGPRIAAISLDGWDTHAGQVGQLNTRLSYLDAVLDGLNTGLERRVEQHRGGGRHRVRPHRPGQRHRRHRPRHRLDRPGAGRRPEEGRHHRRLAHPEAGRPVREPRRAPHPRHARPVQGRCWPSTWASTARLVWRPSSLPRQREDPTAREALRR
jgi:uncharacterized protein (DUF1501 family)